MLVQVLLAADLVELALEVVELLERGFAHEVEHAVAGVLGGYLQSAADVAADEFAGVLAGGTVGGFVLAVVEQQVVTHAAAYEALLDAGQGVDGAVDVDELGVVGVEVGTDLGMYAAGSLAPFAGGVVAAVHAVHVGRGSAEVAEVAFEVGHLDDLLHLAQYALLGAAGDELALMGGDGAEGAAAEAASVDVDRELDHVVGGDALAPVLGVGLARVGQVEGGVELLGGHRGIGRVDYHSRGTGAAFEGLYESLGVHHVRLLLDVAEVLGLCPFVAQTLFVAVEDDVVGGGGDVVGEVDGLGDGFE